MQDADEKLDQWMRFYRSVQVLLRAGPRALRRLSAAELTRLIDDYQGLTADLARARSFGAARQTVDQLNRIAVAGWGIGVALSEDRGKTWELRNAGLPTNSVWSVVFDPAAPGRVYELEA